MAEIELKPCPFCGGEAEIAQFGDCLKSTLYRCRMCGCYLVTGEERDHGNRWNERAKPKWRPIAEFDKTAKIPSGKMLYLAINTEIGPHITRSLGWSERYERFSDWICKFPPTHFVIVDKPVPDFPRD